MEMHSSAMSDARRSALRTLAGSRFALRHANPARLLLAGYLSYIVVGWCLLSLPFAQSQPVSALDNLFMATSAVSTTGLVSVDPGSSYTFFGEAVLLLLIQLGGLGYMTVGSFAVLALAHNLGPLRQTTARAAFSLPADMNVASFLRSVVLFTVVTELIGMLILWDLFSNRGVENPLWSALFHSVSAFCTAGFSLFPNSFEDFRADVPVNLTIAALSLLGAMGFIIIGDTWRTMTGRKRKLGFTSKVIARMTLIFLVVGTALLFVAEPGIDALPPGERLLTAFFQTMTASTTVGFDTYPIGSLTHASIIVLIFLMAIGASPAGTGGGLKTTTFAVLLGLVRSTLRGRRNVHFFHRQVKPARVQTAGAALAYFLGLMLIALFLLLLTEPQATFEKVVFEAVSAMGTVGLSMGITGELSYLGKIIIVVLMIAGRLGFLTFGIALATVDEPNEKSDNDLVL